MFNNLFRFVHNIECSSYTYLLIGLVNYFYETIIRIIVENEDKIIID
jgi:hypothetical protein